jgi:hypothetical protein
MAKTFRVGLIGYRFMNRALLWWGLSRCDKPVAERSVRRRNRSQTEKLSRLKMTAAWSVPSRRATWHTSPTPSPSVLRTTLVNI